MESEGPYTLRSNDKPDGEWLVFGPSLNPSGSFEFCGEDLASALNSAHAEGQKSMEKKLHDVELSLKHLVDRHESLVDDFKELLELANRFRHSSRYSGGLKWIIDFEREFDAWKKARGIE